MARSSGWVRLSSGGRGGSYHPLRGIVESALRLLYAGNWPARAWALIPGTTRVQVVRHRLNLLGGAGQRLRVGFVSDLHIGPTTPSETIDAAFDALAAEDLDVLLLGGDYVFLDANPRVADELFARIERVNAKSKLAVLGNHDLWTEHALLEAALERAGVQLIVNRAVSLPVPFSDIAVVGLDDPWTGQPNADAALSGTEGARVRLAVCHSPDGMAFLRNRSVSFMVCGHTHGGQIALPGSVPIYLPPGPYSKRLSAGLQDVEGVKVYVSRGVGTTELPIRTYAPPEVAVFEFY